MNADQKVRFKKAEQIIAEIQIELLKEAEASKSGDESWRDLYWIRCRLGEFGHYGHVLTRR